MSVCTHEGISWCELDRKFKPKIPVFTYEDIRLFISQYMLKREPESYVLVCTHDDIQLLIVQYTLNRTSKTQVYTCGLLKASIRPHLSVCTRKDTQAPSVTCTFKGIHLLIFLHTLEKTPKAPSVCLYL